AAGRSSEEVVDASEGQRKRRAASGLARAGSGGHRAVAGGGRPDKGASAKTRAAGPRQQTGRPAVLPPPRGTQQGTCRPAVVRPPGGSDCHGQKGEGEDQEGQNAGNHSGGQQPSKGVLRS